MSWLPVTYGPIRATMEWQGTPIGAMDLLITAHALSLGVIMVTNNPRELRRVEGLQEVMCFQTNGAL